MKTLRIFALLLATCLFANLAQAKNTMLWEMLPNESLIELAAKFYPKSATMQRAFVKKAQQLNQDTQVFANPHARYPAATKIVIPTLKSLSVKGVGGKKYKRKKRVTKAKATAPESRPQSAAMSKKQQQLTEKKQTLDASLAKQEADMKALEEKRAAIRKKLDAIEQTKAAVEEKSAPAEKPTAERPPV